MSHPIRLSLILLLAFTSFGILRASGVEFHVSPQGNDRNVGTVAHPFRTLPRAQQAVLEFRKSHASLQDTVTVFLHGGRYALTAPLMFGPDDGGTMQSPTVYTSYKNEQPVISGGVQVKGWREGMFDGKHVWIAPVPPGGRHSAVHQIWIDGQRRSAARMPDTGYFQVSTIPDITPKTEWLDGQTSFMANPGDLPATLDVAGAEAVVMNRWVESRLPLAAYDGMKGLLSFSRRSVFRLDPGDPYYLLNIRAGLDTVGEWYYDAARRTIAYLPMKDEKRESIEAIIPLLTQLVRIEGRPEKGQWVEHLIFRGITYSHNEWYFPPGFKSDSRNTDAGGFVQAATGVPAAIEFSGTRKCVLENCTIDHIGTYAVAFGAGCTDNKMLRCDLHDLGGGGIKIGMKTISRDSLESTSGNLVANCNIGDGGKIFHSAIGVWIAQSPRNRLIHNQIHDFSYTGVSIGWTWGYGPADAGGNVVELNHIHHIGLLSDGSGAALSDLGGIYTLGTQRGTVIRRNVFHDIGARVYGGWGIYFDEGSTGILSEQNLVYRTTHGGFHQHYGRENIVRNSIFAFGRDQQIQRTRAENHTSFAFEHNIVLWKGGRFIFGNIHDGDMVLDLNCYWPEDRRFQADSLTFQ